MNAIQTTCDIERCWRDIDPPPRRRASIPARYLDRVRQLAPLVREYAAQSERAGQLAPQVSDAFHAAGLYRIMLPARPRHLRGRSALRALFLFEQQGERATHRAVRTRRQCSPRPGYRDSASTGAARWIQWRTARWPALMPLRSTNACASQAIGMIAHRLVAAATQTAASDAQPPSQA